MPRYIALIEVDLDEPNTAAAVTAADSIAAGISHDALLEGIARNIMILEKDTQYSIALGVVEEVKYCPFIGTIGLCDDPACLMHAAD